MLPPLDQLHPTTRALYEHWQRIHPTPGAFPGRQHFDPLDVPKLLPNLWLVDVARDPWRFRYRVVGTALGEAGAPATRGRYLSSQNPNHNRSSGASLHRHVWAARFARPHPDTARGAQVPTRPLARGCHGAATVATPVVAHSSLVLSAAAVAERRL